MMHFKHDSHLHMSQKVNIHGLIFSIKDYNNYEEKLLKLIKEYLTSQKKQSIVSLNLVLKHYLILNHLEEEKADLNSL